MVLVLQNWDAINQNKSVYHKMASLVPRVSLSLQGGGRSKGGGVGEKRDPWNKVAKWQTCFESIFNTMMHIMPKIKSKKTHLITPFYLCPNVVKSILFPEFFFILQIESKEAWLQRTFASTSCLTCLWC